MLDPAFLENIISEASDTAFALNSLKAVGGGCINNAYVAKGARETYFVKSNRPSFLDAFQAEAQALEEIASANSVRVPRVVTAAADASQSALVLQYIPPGPSSSGNWEKLARGLAALHAQPQAFFGWKRDNWIGATPQPNQRREQWVDFFREHRLGYQIKLCRDKGFALSGGDRLLSQLDAFFEGETVRPSLLHGDLWSGNVAFDAQGQPFIFDPGAYYGDREADIAFTEFFGGFPSEFYAAYQEALPLNSGYTRRKTLYNLYHCLNHVVLFGSSYADQAQAMTNQLLGEL